MTRPRSIINPSRDKITFWCLFAAQAAGAQILLWVALPIYRSLLDDRPSGADAREIAMVIVAVAFMQAAYWCAFHLQPGLRFRRNIVLGHVLLWLGELRFFFPSALAAVILIDRFKEARLVPWKLPERRALLQVVGKRVDLSEGDEWNERERRSRIVLIAAAGCIDESDLYHRFESCVSNLGIRRNPNQPE